MKKECKLTFLVKINRVENSYAVSDCAHCPCMLKVIKMWGNKSFGRFSWKTLRNDFGKWMNSERVLCSDLVSVWRTLNFNVQTELRTSYIFAEQFEPKLTKHLMDFQKSAFFNFNYSRFRASGFLSGFFFVMVFLLIRFFSSGFYKKIIWFFLIRFFFHPV